MATERKAAVSVSEHARRTRRLIWIIPVCLALVVVAFVGFHRGATKAITNGSGELPVSGGSGSCVELYSAATLTHRSFAFDGTVVSVGRGQSGDAFSTNGVTFEVNEWFIGPTSVPRVVVDLAKPAHVSGADGAEYASYGPGTRLLVSGEPRWGGAPMDQAIAWGCGFTRYFDADDAQLWRNASPNDS